jgi:hypothetical protein
LHECMDSNAMRRFSVTYLKGSGSTLSARIMYPGLMVRAVSTQAAEVSTSSIQYFFSTYLILLSRTYGRVQRQLTSAYDFQVETRIPCEDCFLHRQTGGSRLVLAAVLSARLSASACIFTIASPTSCVSCAWYW